MALIGLITEEDSYNDKVLSHTPTRYWPLDDEDGVVARELVAEDHGDYIGPPDLGFSSFLDGHPSPRFGGAAAPSGVDIYSSDFSDVFDGDEYSVMIWFKFDADAWTDGLNHGLIYLQGTVPGHSQNYFGLEKVAGTPNELLVFDSYAGGWSHAISRTDWVCFIFTKSVANNRIKMYIDGVQVETTLPATAWPSHDLATDGATLFGRFLDPLFYPMLGSGARKAYWNRELVQAEITDLAVVI